MLRIRLVVLLAASVFLFSAGTEAKAESSFGGLTGLVGMRTPDLIGEYRNEIMLSTGLLGGLDGAKPGFGLSLGYTQGLGEWAEAGFQMPLMFTPRFGLRPVSFLVKGRFLNHEDWRAGATAFVSTPAPRSRNLGSGSFGIGAELNGSWNSSLLTVALSLGYMRADYCSGCVIPGTQLVLPRAVPTLYGSLGVGRKFEDHMGTIEISGEWAHNGDKNGIVDGDPNLYAIVGGRLRLPEGFAVSAGLGPAIFSLDNVGFAGRVMAHYVAIDF